MKRILVIGGGFAGLWSAVSAARRADEIGADVEIMLINKDANHGIRVRNYEDDLADTLVPLHQVLDPIGVKLVIGDVIDINAAQHSVTVASDGIVSQLQYAKLIVCSGSQLVRPSIPGLSENSFDVDTHAAASRLQAHVTALAKLPQRKGQFTALVIGSGATGVELATELPARLRAAAEASGSASAVNEVRVILADRAAQISGGLGGARAVIERACVEMGIELRTDFALKSVDDRGVVLADGSRIEASTVVWCAGMAASPLNEKVVHGRDAQGRIFVDSFLRVKGVEDVFAAGDAAHMLIDGQMPSVMSCQHARPMGRFAGHNALGALFGKDLEPLSIDWYTNIIDLGPWGAVYSQGWDRTVVAEGEMAKKTKMVINRERIYPPRNGDRKQILASGALDLQRPPALPPLKRAETAVSGSVPYVPKASGSTESAAAPR